jgi:holo-[acyl-carrier protein] synthase
MLVGVGVDIVHLPRIASIIAKRRNNCQLLCRRILSPKEQDEFRTRFVNQQTQPDSVPNPDLVRFLATRYEK